MGREAYLMRLALGLSALEPPEDSETFTAARAGDWASAVHTQGVSEPSAALGNPSSLLPPHGVQLYNARGHPFNPWARARSRKLREAQNDILSVIGVTERKIPVDRFDHDGGVYPASGHEVDPDEDEAGDIIGTVADFDYQFLSWWIHALTNRLLVFPPTRDTSFVGIVQLQWRVLGWRRFLFAGLPSFMTSHVVNPELWTQFILNNVFDRAVIAYVSSRQRREAYENIYRPILAGVIEVSMNLFVLPFRVHSMLQLLGFEPSGTWLLPHPRSWMPFHGTSLIQWSWNTQPLLAFFLFRPLSSLVHQYFFMSCRSAIMEPVDAMYRRKSSGSRFATSVNAAHILELPNEATALTAVFRRAFNFLSWGHPSYIPEKPDMHFHPGLRRRETWPVADHQAAPLAPEIPGQDPEEITPETETEVGPLPDPSTPRPQRVHAAATLNDSPIERDRDDTSGATIRVSYPDPDTGYVNFVIEEAIHEHETTIDSIEAEAEAEATMLARRRQDLELFQKPHHVSRLALEPTELLASLVNGWVAGWVLMPLRVVVLRQLVRDVMLRPEAFGVNEIQTRALPGLLSSSISVLAPGGANTRGIKYVALSCLTDVSLGLGYWLAEWATVRWIGVHVFNWGSF